MSDGNRYAAQVSGDANDSLSQLARWIAPKSTVLDVGCAAGEFGEYLLREHGCVVDGVDADVAMAATARAAYRRVVVADLDRSRLEDLFPRAAYDYVVFADVLEHVRDAGALLADARALLKNDGRVLISVPNVAYAPLLAELLGGRFAYREAGLLDRTHIRLLTRSTVDEMVRAAQLTPVEVSRVLRSAADSEFDVRFAEALPPAVAVYLDSQPEAYTYQFLLNCTPSPAAREARDITPRLESPTPPQFVSRLFWRVPDRPWAAEQSAVAMGEIGARNQVLRFTIPCGADALALELCDRETILQLRRIDVVSDDVIWSWNGDGAVLLAAPHARMSFAPAEEGVMVIIGGREPRLHLPVDAETLLRADRAITVEVELDWPRSPEYQQIVAELRDRFVELDTATSRLAELERLQEERAERERLAISAAERSASSWVVVVPVGDERELAQRTVDALAASLADPDRVRTIDGSAWDAVQQALEEDPERDVLVVAPGIVPPPMLDLRLRWSVESAPGTAAVSPLCDVDPVTSLARHGIDTSDALALDRRIAGGAPMIEAPYFIPECFYLRARAARRVKAASLAGLTATLRDDGHVIGIAPHLFAGAEIPRRDTPWLESPNIDVFLTETPLHDVARRLAKEDAAPPAAPIYSRTRPRVLHISHSLGGGLERWVKLFSSSSERCDNFVLKSIGEKGRFGSQLWLFDTRDPSAPVRTWRLSQPIVSTASSHLEYRRVIAEVIEELGVDAVIVSSLIGHSLDVLATGTPTLFVCHDYYPYCPAVHIYFNGICTRCTVAELTACCETNPLNNLFPGESAQHWMMIRSAFQEALRAPFVKVVAPSHSVIRNLETLGAGISADVVPHGTDQSDVWPEDGISPKNGPKLSIVVPGRLTAEKGLSLLEDVIRRTKTEAEFTLLGCGSAAAHLAGRNVRVIEHYSRAQLPSLLAEIQPDLALLLSFVPETFSFTLDECFSARIPVVAVRSGALSERIADGRTGFLCEPRSDEIAEQVRGLAADRQLLASVRANLASIERRTAEQMIADYLELLGVPRQSPRAYFSRLWQRDEEGQDRAPSGWMLSEAAGLGFAEFLLQTEEAAYYHIRATRRLREWQRRIASRAARAGFGSLRFLMGRLLPRTTHLLLILLLLAAACGPRQHAASAAEAARPSTTRVEVLDIDFTAPGALDKVVVVDARTQLTPEGVRISPTSPDPLIAFHEAITANRIEIEMRSEQPGFVEVFWAPSGEEFSEDRKKRIALMEGAGFVTHTFELGADAGPYRLRIDPIDSQAPVTIRTIRMSKANRGTTSATLPTGRVRTSLLPATRTGRVEAALRFPPNGTLAFACTAAVSGKLDERATVEIWIQPEGSPAILLDVIPFHAGTRGVEAVVDLSPYAGTTGLLRLNAGPTAVQWQSAEIRGDADARIPPPNGAPNVVVFLIDTLRSDVLGCYGGPGPTPTLDRLAAGGTLFERAYSTASWTRPSVATLFSGLPVASHRVVTDDDGLPDGVLTLAERFRLRGYETIGVLSNKHLLAEYNFDQGFETYAFVEAPEAAGPVFAPDLVVPKPSAAEVHAEVLRQLAARRHPDRPLFLYVHTVDPHNPYDPPRWLLPDQKPALNANNHLLRSICEGEGASPRILRDLATQYRGAVAYADDELGRLLQALAAKLDLDRTILVATSDHGEAFFEHRLVGHRHWPHEELIRVPLIIRGPGIPAGARQSDPASLEDVTPTLMAATGGSSRSAGFATGLDLFAGGRRDRTVPVEHFNGSAIVRGEWKLTHRTDFPAHLAFSLFNLRQDPREERDLVETRRDVGDEMESAFRRSRARAAAVAVERRPVTGVSESVLQNLRALGYLQ